MKGVPSLFEGYEETAHPPDTTKAADRDQRCSSGIWRSETGRLSQSSLPAVFFGNPARRASPNTVELVVTGLGIVIYGSASVLRSVVAKPRPIYRAFRRRRYSARRWRRVGRAASGPSRQPGSPLVVTHKSIERANEIPPSSPFL